MQISTGLDVCFGLSWGIKRMCMPLKILWDLTAQKLLHCNKASGLASNIYWTRGLNSLKTKLSLCAGIFKGFLHREEQGRWQLETVHTLAVLHFRETLLVQDQTFTPGKAVSFTKLLFSQFFFSVFNIKVPEDKGTAEGQPRSKAESFCFVPNLLFVPAARAAKLPELLYLVPDPAVPCSVSQRFPISCGSDAFGSLQGRSCICKWV